jgi:hypothetical protein
MPRRLPSLAIVLLLVGQGLLATSGLWHRHGGEGPTRAGAGAVEPAHGCCHQDAPGDEPEPPAPAGEDDDCAICLIVATQRIDLVDRAEAIAPSLAAAQIRLPRAHRPGRLDRVPPRSRGPPAFNRA